MNRINFAILTFFICILKRKVICFSREHMKMKTWKKGHYSRESFHLAKFSLIVLVGKLDKFVLAWHRRTCQISHCMGAWNPWKLDNNEKGCTSQKKREVIFNFHHSVPQGQNRLKQIPHPWAQRAGLFPKVTKGDGNRLNWTIQNKLNKPFV